MREEGWKKKDSIRKGYLCDEDRETLLKIWKGLCMRTTSNINILFDFVFLGNIYILPMSY